MIYTDLTAGALPDHHLYEGVEEGRVIGFVLVRRRLKSRVWIDRAGLEGLPARDTSAPFLAEKRRPASPAPNAWSLPGRSVG